MAEKQTNGGTVPPDAQDFSSLFLDPALGDVRRPAGRLPFFLVLKSDRKLSPEILVQQTNTFS
jgi:hypothetical protein